jgi:hypothetical protein
MLGGQTGHVLDLGCGPGLYTSRLAQLGHIPVTASTSLRHRSIMPARPPLNWGCLAPTSTRMYARLSLVRISTW